MPSELFVDRRPFIAGALEFLKQPHYLDGVFLRDFIPVAMAERTEKFQVDIVIVGYEGLLNIPPKFSVHVQQVLEQGANVKRRPFVGFRVLGGFEFQRIQDQAGLVHVAPREPASSRTKRYAAVFRDPLHRLPGRVLPNVFFCDPTPVHEHEPVSGDEEIQIGSEDRAIGRIKIERRASPGRANQWEDQRQTT